MPILEYIIQPQGRVLQAYADSNKHVQIIRGPLGSGKTVQTILKIVDLMAEQQADTNGVRKSRWAAVRNTYPDLFTTTIKDWLEIHGDLGEFNAGGKKPPEHLLRFQLEDGTKVESEMIFLSFDRPDHVKKARGLQLTGVWLNEVKELSKPVVDILDLRVGRYPSKKEGSHPTWYGMLGDTNSPDEDHWLYKLAEEDQPEDWAFFHQPGGVVKQGERWIVNEQAENIRNLPENYYKRGMQGKAEDWIAVMLGNQYGFVSEGRPVHPRYNDSVHCQHIDYKPDPDKPIMLGADFGRTPAVALAQQNSFGSWVFFDEFTSEDMSAITFVPELKKYLAATYPGHPLAGYGDPSGDNRSQSTEDTPFRIFNAAGIPIKPTATNDPSIRRAAMEMPLTEIAMDGNPRVIILPQCKMLRKGLAGGFCYKRVQTAGDERYHDEPDKNKYSHIVEAAEYLLQGNGEGKDMLVRHSSNGYDDWEQPINV